MIKNKHFRIFIVFILSVSMTTGLFVSQKREVDAVAIAIPVVAIPIIKMMIAGGVTFATTDAMMEAYNRFSGTEYYSTVSGQIMDKVKEQFDYYVINPELMKYFKSDNGGEPPEDPFDDKEILINMSLGMTIMENGQEIFDTFWNNLKSFMGDFFKKGENLSELEFKGENEFHKYYGTTEGENSVELSKNANISFKKLEDGRINISVTYIPTGFQTGVTLTVGETRYIDWKYINNGSRNFVWVYLKRTSNDVMVSNHTLDLPKETVPVVNPPSEFKNIPYVGEDVLDNNDIWHSSETGGSDIHIPIPAELLMYNEEDDKIMIGDDISPESFQEIMSPYVEIPYEQVRNEPSPQKFPNPNFVPDLNPEPEPEPEPELEPEPKPVPDGFWEKLWYWLERIYDAIKDFAKSFDNKIDEMISLITPTPGPEPEPEPEPVPDPLEELEENVGNLQEELEGKLGVPLLQKSFEKIKGMSTSKGSPPVVYVDLNGMFSSMAGKRHPTLSDKAVLIDFAFMESQEWQIFGMLSLIDIFRSIVTVGFVLTTGNYVWRKIIPDKVVD